MARPTKYKPEYAKKLITFFSIPPNKIVKKKVGKDTKEITVLNELPFFSIFAHNIGVCHDTLCEWVKVHKEFSEAYKKAKELQKAFLITNGLAGLYNPAFAIFTAKNITDMRDKNETEISLKSWPESIKVTIANGSTDK